MDFFFISSLINMIWQIFTILFVLYRFTSFFNMMYNFILFINKIFKGVFYIKDQITIYINKRRGYSYFTENNMDEISNSQKSWFTKLKEWIFNKRSPSPNIPLFETRHSYFNSMNSELQSSTSESQFNDNQPSTSESQFNDNQPFTSESLFTFKSQFNESHYDNTESRFNSTLYKLSSVTLEKDEEELAQALMKSSNEF
jgi:hypothetical protein